MAERVPAPQETAINPETQTRIEQALAREDEVRPPPTAFDAAHAEGDVDALVALFDAQWRVQGDPDVPWIGEHRGRCGVRGFLGAFSANRQVEGEETITQTVHRNHRIQIDRRTLRVKRNGARTVSDVTVHFVIRDGKIAEQDVFENAHAVSRARPGHGTLPEEKVA